MTSLLADSVPWLAGWLAGWLAAVVCVRAARADRADVACGCVLIMIPGHAYVYKSFRGHNDCFNITSDSAGVPAAVLIRVVTLLPASPHYVFLYNL